MFKKLFKPRVHESVAIAALFSASITLNVAWIINLLVHRSDRVWAWFEMSERIGPISGMYTKTLLSFFCVMFVTWMFCRGKDCSHQREGVFWFFVASIVLFLVMTLPFVYEFQIGV
ncbi:hypothetical protein HOI18_03370 [Candidatus Uhrbacteria bacterium]|jgi:hypothetical protein|nr:hypothetical protein [Candidatus Uhrbacteria bacterium]